MANINANANVEDDDDELDSDYEDEEEETYEQRQLRYVEENRVQAIAYFTEALIVCGITNPQVIAYIDTSMGIRNVDTLSDVSVLGLWDMLKRINKTANQTPVIRRIGGPMFVVSEISKKRLVSFREWIKWRNACSQDVLAQYFDVVSMKWGVARLDFEERLKVGDATISPKPEKLTGIGYKVWHPFERQLNNYLGTIRGTLNIPLSYVIRRTILQGVNVMDEELYTTSDEALIACVSLRGTYYNEDNAKVWDIIQSCASEGNAFPFIKKFQTKKDGRSAILALRGQAEGAAANETRLSVAYNIMNTTTYDGKGAMRFDSFIEQLQFAFSELEECGDPQSEYHKILKLREGCVSDLMQGARELVVNSTLFPTFLDACEGIQGWIGRNLPSAMVARRNVSATDTGTVDESDLKESYTPTEWKYLHDDIRTRVIRRNRARKKLEEPTTEPTTVPVSKRKYPSGAATAAKRKVKKVASIPRRKTGDSSSDDDTDDTADTVRVRKTSAVKFKDQDTKPKAKKT